jgi:HD-GYP domain-containing protein (c-di-GMP phosphodiesterase class II)
MIQNIHKVVFKRLLGVGTLIAIVVSALALYIELDRIEKNVVHVAYKESKQYIEFYNQYLMHDHGTNNLNVFRKAIEDRLEFSHFIILEFYTEKHDLLLRAGTVDVDKIRSELMRKDHKVLMDDNVNYKTFFVHNAFKNELYLDVEIPLTKNGSKQIEGFLKGIYKVTSKEIEVMKNDAAFVVAQYAATVVFTTFLLYPIIILLNKNLLKSTNDLFKANITLLKVLGGAIAKRDSNTNTHNYRVTIYAICLARAINLDKPQIRALIKGAFLHDVGKIGISDNILLKPGELEDNEFKEMQRHVIYGVEIINHSEWLYDAVDVVKFHHERFDGKGYMSGLAGKMIPLNARIFTVVDVFDALTSKRPYKNAFSYEESMNLIDKGAGSHFDPELVRAFEGIAEGIYFKLNNLKTENELSKELDVLMNEYFII